MIRRLLLIAALSAAPLAPLPARAADAPLQDRLAGVLAQEAPRYSHVGVSVVALADGHTLFERNADKLFTPASLQKILTSSAALALLGTQKRFATRLLSDAVVENGKLRGHLYLRGEGDPVLEAPDLDALASELRGKGIREVAGDLVVDAGLFTGEERAAPGWSWDDLAYDYGAPVSALSLHHNMVELTVAPGATAGQAANYALTPPTGYVKVTNRAKTGPGELTVRAMPGAGYERWVLDGAIAAGSPQESLKRSINDPVRFVGLTMKEALARRGIAVAGAVRPGATPRGARAYATHLSPPLADLVHEMNKVSDNLIAETLLYHVGIRAKGAPGTREKGLAAVRDFLARAGWKEGEYRIEDGCGLSRYDAVTPAQLTRLLAHMPSERLAYPALLVSLPVAGVDGTLADRLDGAATRGRMRGKTGTMSGVSGLAGYVQLPTGEWVAVAVMVNGFVGPAEPSRALQDKLIEALEQ